MTQTTTPVPSVPKLILTAGHFLDKPRIELRAFSNASIRTSVARFLSAMGLIDTSSHSSVAIRVTSFCIL